MACPAQLVAYWRQSVNIDVRWRGKLSMVRCVAGEERCAYGHNVVTGSDVSGTCSPPRRIDPERLDSKHTNDQCGDLLKA